MPTLSEADSKALLGAYGVPVPDERWCATADEAAAAADAIGYPVVAKLCGDAIAHKTERGLVRLGLGRRRRGARRGRRAAGRGHARGRRRSTCWWRPMVRATRELIAGLATTTRSSA